MANRPAAASPPQAQPASGYLNNPTCHCGRERPADARQCIGCEREDAETARFIPPPRAMPRREPVLKRFTLADRRPSRLVAVTL